jgi:hypothetical protein
MDKNELRYHLQKCEKLNQRRKLKRFCYTVLFYAAVFFGICYLQGRLEGATLFDLIGEFAVCVILSVISTLFNLIVFEQLIRKSKEEDEALEFLRKRLREKEKEST